MENFIVSARKYRPATFASVVGQKHITSTLKNAIERGQLAHAYLFCGPRGVGKTTCARIFAKSINCLDPKGAEACNECESCRTFNENRSLNIHELDAASNNSVDDIRNLIDQVRVIPQVGRYSVFIIDEVHMLSQQAFNAFLKTLEEPPAHAIFILATTEKHKIIPTILSRCQIYDFNRIKVEDAVDYLKYIAGEEGVTYDDESLNLIARKADGGMRDALSMFDKAVSFCGADLRFKDVAQTLNVLDYDTYFRITDTLLAGDYITALLEFDRVLSDGFSGQIFMAGLCQHMRDLLLARGSAASLIELTGALLDRYREQAAKCDPEFLFGAINILTEADGRIRQASSQRLTVELGLMKIAALGQKKNDSALTEGALRMQPAEQYPLPDLNQKPTQVKAPAPAQAQISSPTQAPISASASALVSAPAPASKPVAEPASAPIPAPAPAPAPAASSVQVSTASSAKQPTEPSAQPSTQAAKPASSTKPAAEQKPSSKPLMSGMSLTSLLNGIGTVEESAPVNVAQTVIDADSAAKLTAHRQQILDYVTEQRPRFVVAFETMRFDGNAICIKVPSSSLREEIEQASVEMLTHIVSMAGIGGLLELKIEVAADDKRKVRPIKLEDRIQYMEQKNPHLVELRKNLELDVD